MFCSVIWALYIRLLLQYVELCQEMHVFTLFGSDYIFGSNTTLTAVSCTPSATLPGFEPMTSRSRMVHLMSLRRRRLNHLASGISEIEEKCTVTLS